MDLQSVRNDFPVLRQRLPNGRPLVYLDTGATAQKPQVVIDKEVECYTQYYANVHRGIHSLGDRVTTELEAAREKIQHWIGAAQPEEIIFTGGTTASINTVANGWGRKFLQPGDEILLNELEHHANLVPWQQASRATGAQLRYIPLTPDGQLAMDRLGEVLTARTRLVAVTGMSNVLGTLPPLGELSRRAHDVGALILVDGAQSVPHQAVNVRQPAIDFLAFSGHKLYGPSGVGVLYGRRELLEAMDPFLCGGNMIREVFRDHSTWADLPGKFEAGTLPIAQAIALGAAVDYLKVLGLDAIHAHEQSVTEYAWNRLREIPDLQILGPALAQRGSILSFTLQGVHPHDMAELLNTHGVAVRAGHHCTMPLHDWLGISASTRASFGLYNTTDEVDVLIEAVQHARRVFRRANLP